MIEKDSDPMVISFLGFFALLGTEFTCPNVRRRGETDECPILAGEERCIA
jgi:hypothetical protein